MTVRTQTRWQRGVLKLARAMAQGCKKTKPTTGVLLEDDRDRNDEDVFFACALGAAFVDGRSAARAMQSFRRYGDGSLSRDYPVLDVAAEDRHGLMRQLSEEIVARNDDLGHTRARIVKWLKRLAKLPEPPKRWNAIRAKA